jgi:thiamine kinase-like enzyme
MPENLLHNWRRWGLQQRPELQRQLPGGLTNHSYLLRAGSRSLVLRVGLGIDGELGIDRQREDHVLSVVSAAGIAPQVIYNNPTEGILLSEYIHGEHWQGLSAQRGERLLQLMQHVHSLETPLPRFNYLQHAESYWQHIIERGELVDDALTAERERMLPVLREFQQQCRCSGLCHHDPLAANIIDSDGRLYLLDWEYAAGGCRTFDYAALAAEWGGKLTLPVIACDQQPGNDVYQYLCRLWMALRGPVKKLP